MVKLKDKHKFTCLRIVLSYILALNFFIRNRRLESQIPCAYAAGYACRHPSKFSSAAAATFYAYVLLRTLSVHYFIWRNCPLRCADTGHFDIVM